MKKSEMKMGDVVYHIISGDRMIVYCLNTSAGHFRGRDSSGKVRNVTLQKL